MGWVDRNPWAFVALILGVVAFGCCGVLGVVGFVVSAEEEPITAEQRDDSESPEATEADEPQAVVESTSSSESREPTESEETTEPEEPEEPRSYVVVRIIDGDTLELGNGEIVRLAGIDAPEVGECGYLKAADRLAALVDGQAVTLAESDEDHDRYGRLLRYVDLGGMDSGLRLIKAGLAIARYDSRDGYGRHPREDEYIAADKTRPNVKCAPPPNTFVDNNPSSCAPGYSPCIPAYPPDLDCADTGPVTVTGSDPHGLDADGDGVACGGD